MRLTKHQQEFVKFAVNNYSSSIERILALGFKRSTLECLINKNALTTHDGCIYVPTDTYKGYKLHDKTYTMPTIELCKIKLATKSTINSDGSEVFNFWAQDEVNGLFSNLFYSPVRLFDKWWDTSEHIYQASKHTKEDVIEKIRRQQKPLNAKFVARKKCKQLDCWPDDEHKLRTMAVAVKAKFDQHMPLRRILVRTHPHKISENSNTDSFWGTGEDGLGDDHMGKMLMALRDHYVLNQPFLYTK
jgi:ribA/ribD-fused uncharacterized protein